MDMSKYLKDKPELGVEEYTENFEPEKHECNCKSKGISILKRVESDEKIEHI